VDGALRNLWLEKRCSAGVIPATSGLMLAVAKLLLHGWAA
jgi:hypothetical protein